MLFINLGLAGWLSAAAKRNNHKPAWPWWLFTIVSGILAPLIYFAYTTRHYGDVLVNQVVFATQVPREIELKNALLNPDVSALQVPLLGVQQLIIYAELHNLHQLEQFLSYAIDYLGPDYLSRNVTVSLYGDAERLHPNLRNNLENLGLRISLYGQEAL
jgi:hypothetical protein